MSGGRCVLPAATWLLLLQVQIYDLQGFKLSYVMGDMLQLFKMLVRFGLYYPERLRMALVINAPAWFSTPWKAMAAFLDENTASKVGGGDWNDMLVTSLMGC